MPKKTRQTSPPQVSPLTRIMLIDEHPVVREGLIKIFGSEPDMRVVADLDNSETSFVIFEKLRPSVVLLDLRLSCHRNP